MKKFTSFEISSIKKVAQASNNILTKKNKLKAQIDALTEEYNSLCAIQEQYDAPVKTITGGYGIEDIITKVIEDTGKTDKNGNPIKTTKYVLKYPETVIPVEVNLMNGEQADDVEFIEDAEEVNLNEDTNPIAGPAVPEDLFAE